MTSDEQSLESLGFRIIFLSIGRPRFNPIETPFTGYYRTIFGRAKSTRRRIGFEQSKSSHGTRLQRRNYSLFTVCSRPNTLSVVAVLPGLGLCSTNRMPFRVFEPSPLRLPTVSEPTFLSVTNRNERERE